MIDEPPAIIWFNGKVSPWRDAVHVWSEVAVRGTSVFDGLRAYWSAADALPRRVAR